MSATAAGTDRDQIVAHIHGLFQAYIDKDREAIRRGHTSDWRGFQIPSRSIVRGIDAYMESADRVIQSFNGYRYEILDIEVDVHGDRAVVFYVSREWIRNPGGPDRVLDLRCVDLYRREASGWNQYGSNICFLPDAK